MVVNAVNDGPTGVINLVRENWQSLLLQYIGLLTAVVVGVLLALFLPFIGQTEKNIKIFFSKKLFRFDRVLLSLCWEMWSLPRHLL